MLAAEPFSRKLRWALLGLYAVLFGGALVVALIRFLVDAHFFTRYFALAVAIALLVQLVAVFVAIRLLARDPRYRSRMNIALTVAGVIPTTYVVVSAMLFGVRFHI